MKDDKKERTPDRPIERKRRKRKEIAKTIKKNSS